MKNILKFRKWGLTSGVLVLFSFVLVMPAIAATDKEDLLVGMKLLPLLSEKITGNTKLAIIFDPTNASSQQEAKGIKTILDGNLVVSGDIKLLPVLVPITDLNGLIGSRVAILSEGLSKYYDDIDKITTSNSIVTMSTDLACARAKQCIIGIVSKPKVEIYYSKSAAEASKITFSQVFSLLVKQI